ncbi:MAG TPA: hypothetical protein VNI01_14475, partial [Elusimicrobiota bacterium]|nr:hypothetical protein [Elusimicrobiota bacterium]
MKPNPILRLLAAAALAAAPGAPSAQAIGSARGPVGRSGAAPAVVSVNLPDAAASLGGAAQTQLGIDPSLARSPSPAGDILVPAEPSLERLEALPLSTDPIGPADVPASTSEKNHPPAPVSGESGEKHASIERSPSQGREESPDDPEGHAREPEIRARLRASVQGLDGAPSAESNEDAWRRADFVEPQGSSPADPGAPAPPRVGLFHHEPGGERPFLGGTLAAQLGSNAM